MADKLIRTDARNTTDRAQQLNAIPPVRVEAGQSVQDAEMSEAEFESAKHFGVFEFSGTKTAKDSAPEPAKGAPTAKKAD